MSEPPNRDISEELIRQGIISSDDTNTALAQQFGMPVVPQITAFNLSKEIYDKVPYSFVKRHTVLPFDQDGEKSGGCGSRSAEFGSTSRSALYAEYGDQGGIYAQRCHTDSH